ncbi:MAG TPA: NAD(P)H-binding protein [Actinospica sp.]|nr:NAD(P)H-binding protein [Actinospica sp.]
MIVITSPTSKIGTRLLGRVLAGDEPVRVIARDPGRLAPEVRERAEVVRGSHSDAVVVDAAFAGADAVFWLVPADPLAPDAESAYSGFAAAGIEAFARHRVRHVVGVSALGRGTAVAARAGHVTGTLAMDDRIAKSGVHYRALANPSFMDNTLRAIPLIKSQGVISDLFAPDRRLPVVATRDIGDVAATLLLDRDWSGVEEVPLLGPEDLTPDETAAIVAEELGTPVTYRQISGDTLKAALAGRFSDGMAQAMVEMGLAKDAGLDTGVRRTPQDAVRTPTTFRTWCREILKPAFDAA